MNAARADCRTSLEAEETTGRTAAHPAVDPFTVPSDPSVPWRHSGWSNDRESTRMALVRLGYPAARLARFDLCGDRAWVLCAVGDPPRYRIASTKCHDRWCRPCQRERAGRVAFNLRAHIANSPHRFITLTLRSSDTDLAWQLDRLNRCFRCLRRSDWWRTRVRGGASFVEVTRNERTGLWHPHLHLIVDSAYLLQSDLSARWLGVTGDSAIVDVRLVRDDAHLARYVAKYLCKVVPSGVVRNPEALDAAILALHGRRSFTTFGAWRGLDLSASPPDEIWVAVAPLHVILEDARAGDLRARAILAQLRRPEQCPAPSSGPPPRPP